jgi:hypothetical protein
MHNWLIVLGATCLAIVVFGNIAEYYDIFPEMGWNRSDSPGRLLFLTSELVGVAAIITWLVSRRPP